MFDRVGSVRGVMASLALGLVLAACGCGLGGSRVSGRVTFDGAPVEDGRIQFRKKSNGQAYSAPIKNGSYSLPCDPGEMSVEITASRMVPGKYDRSNGTAEPVGEMYIPRKYNVTTTLSASIKGGSNTVPFELTSK